MDTMEVHESVSNVVGATAIDSFASYIKEPGPLDDVKASAENGGRTTGCIVCVRCTTGENKEEDETSEVTTWDATH